MPVSTVATTLYDGNNSSTLNVQHAHILCQNLVDAQTVATTPVHRNLAVKYCCVYKCELPYTVLGVQNSMPVSTKCYMDDGCQGLQGGILVEAGEDSNRANITVK